MTLEAYRASRAESKRAAILEAASRLFAEVGHGVSTAAIAGAAGVSTATLYRHFEDKEALFGAVVDFLIDDVIEAIAQRPWATADRLREVTLRYATLLSNPRVVGLIRGIVADARGSSFRDRLDRHGATIFDKEFQREVEALLTEVNPGALPNAALAVLELRSPIEHETLLAGLLFRELPDDAAVEALVERTLKSWRARWLT